LATSSDSSKIRKCHHADYGKEALGMEEGSIMKICPFELHTKIENSSVLTDIGLLRRAERFQLIQAGVSHFENDLIYAKLDDQFMTFCCN
jgi:hypothetical protein